MARNKDKTTLSVTAGGFTGRVGARWLSVEAAPSVFVSYSSEDREWMERFVRQLELPEFLGQLRIAYDERIGCGDRWEPTVERMISEASVGVCLITSRYVVSEPCRKELSALLRRHDAGDLDLVLVQVEPCAWQLDPEIRERQLWPKGESISEDRRDWVDSTFRDLAYLVASLLAPEDDPDGDPPGAGAGSVRRLRRAPRPSEPARASRLRRRRLLWIDDAGEWEPDSAAVRRWLAAVPMVESGTVDPRMPVRPSGRRAMADAPAGHDVGNARALEFAALAEELTELGESRGLGTSTGPVIVELGHDAATTTLAPGMFGFCRGVHVVYISAGAGRNLEKAPNGDAGPDHAPPRSPIAPEEVGRRARASGARPPRDRLQRHRAPFIFDSDGDRPSTGWTSRIDVGWVSTSAPTGDPAAAGPLRPPWVEKGDGVVIVPEAGTEAGPTLSPP